ncbi:hypothetical protein ONE63_005174 [Megalurothrips usitatus]|uniref:Uncharacterized protein n=1 Tax=Megalurothrips usitatus TaxID=439358 RepID=A0AAV7XXT0_9NEOP|nr:hypothetical protein ONE63_005174 [Megalurothrips usitatus]
MNHHKEEPPAILHCLSQLPSSLYIFYLETSSQYKDSGTKYVRDASSFLLETEMYA